MDSTEAPAALSSLPGGDCNTITAMPEQRITTFRLDEDLWAGLQNVKERDGVPVGEQIRRGIKLWLDTRGVKLKGGPKAGRRGARTPRRP